MHFYSFGAFGPLYLPAAQLRVTSYVLAMFQLQAVNSVDAFTFWAVWAWHIGKRAVP